MNSRSLWNLILGSRDIGDAHGEDIIPGLALWSAGSWMLWAVGKEERYLYFYHLFPVSFHLGGAWLPPAFFMGNFLVSYVLSPCFYLHQSNVKVVQQLLTVSQEVFLLLEAGKERRWSQREDLMRWILRNSSEPICSLLSAGAPWAQRSLHEFSQLNWVLLLPTAWWTWNVQGKYPVWSQLQSKKNRHLPPSQTGQKRLCWLGYLDHQETVGTWDNFIIVKVCCNVLPCTL